MVKCYSEIRCRTCVFEREFSKEIIDKPLETVQSRFSSVWRELEQIISCDFVFNWPLGGFKFHSSLILTQKFPTNGWKWYCGIFQVFRRNWMDERAPI